MAKKRGDSSDFLKMFDQKEYLEFWINAYKESDRGMVLLATAFLDEQLGFLHLTHLSEHIRDSELMYKKLSSRFGPLSDFASKIQLGYAYGLLDSETYVELEKLRKIRNEVAHEVTRFSFDDSNAVKRIFELKTVSMEELFANARACGVDSSYMDAIEKYWASQKKLIENNKPQPRGHFMVFAMLMSARLMMITLKTGQQVTKALEKKVEEARKLLENSKASDVSVS